MFVRCRPLWRTSVHLPCRRIITSRLPDVPIPSASYNDHVLAHADEFADRPALVDGTSGCSFSYADVKAGVHRVASALTRRRFGRRHVLSLFTHNCPEALLVCHGALAAGGAVGIVLAGATEEQLVRQLTAAGSRVLVATEEQAATAAAAAAAVGSVEDVYVIGDSVPHGCRSARELTEDDDGGASPWGHVEVLPHDVALMPHSSGTTGLQKTVMITNRNLVANMAQCEGIFDLRPGEESFIGLLPFTSFCIFGIGLHFGATIVTMPRFEALKLLENMETHQTTLLHTVPPILLFLLQSDMTEKFDLSTLERVMCGAAPLHKETHEAMHRKFSRKNPRFQLFQGYGTTEASPVITLTPRARLMPGPKHGSAGLLLPNTECRILDRSTGLEVPEGEEGEIVIRGPQVMPGYLNAPQETAAALRDGWLHTGDIGKVDADGYFFITDRLKELIKYKAFQVAPAEVEDLLLTHPGVADCAVVGRPDERAGELPLAFVVRRGDVDARELCEFVESRLADPSRLRGGVRFVDSIPRSASGKILRRLLRDQVKKM